MGRRLQFTLLVRVCIIAIHHRGRPPPRECLASPHDSSIYGLERIDKGEASHGGCAWDRRAAQYGGIVEHSPRDAMKLLFATEVAALLRVSENRIYELAARHMIPHVRIGRQLRFPEDKLLAWIEAGGAPLEASQLPPPNIAGTTQRRR